MTGPRHYPTPESTEARLAVDLARAALIPDAAPVLDWVREAMWGHVARAQGRVLDLAEQEQAS